MDNKVSFELYSSSSSDQEDDKEGDKLEDSQTDLIKTQCQGSIQDTETTKDDIDQEVQIKEEGDNTKEVVTKPICEFSDSSNESLNKEVLSEDLATGISGLLNKLKN